MLPCFADFALSALIEPNHLGHDGEGPSGSSPFLASGCGQLALLQPVSQVGAIDLERVANLAGLGNPLFPSDPAIECFQERTLYLTYKPSMANVPI